MNVRLRNMTSLYITGERGILCLYRIGSRVANHKYIGSAGGHFENWEMNAPRACVLRELREELSLEEKDLEGLRLRYITHRLKDGEIRQNYYFFATLKEDKDLSSTEGKLEWIPFDRIPELNMPVSAKHMILHYLQKGRFDDALYGGFTQEAGTSFAPLTEFEG